mgnify:CR=1 FL=1|jgi:hypothetical protein
MSEEILPYEVLKPIAYKGDRIEKGSIIHLSPEEAKNIGEEYLKLAEPADEPEIPKEPEPEQPKNTEEEKKEPTEPEKPEDATGEEKKEGDDPSKTEGTQTDNKPDENL